MNQVHVRVPGKVMLAGEYAVLKGSPCLAAAVDQHMHISASQQSVEYLVDSDLWQRSYSIHDVPKALESNPLIQTLRWCQEHWELPPFKLSLRSEFEVTDGFGSSSALRIGCMTALSRLFSHSFDSQHQAQTDPWYIPRQAWQMQLAEQSFASGYDVMTQWLGGFLYFHPGPQNWPGQPRSLARIHDSNSDFLWVIRGGKGAPTTKLGLLTKDWLSKAQLWPDLIQRSHNLVDSLAQCLRSKQPALDQLVRDNFKLRQLFEASPSYPADLLEALKDLPNCDQNWSFKTTGAGGEDALLLIGKKHDVEPAIQYLAQHGWQVLTAKLGCPGLRVDDDKAEKPLIEVEQ